MSISPWQKWQSKGYGYFNPIKKKDVGPVFQSDKETIFGVAKKAAEKIYGFDNLANTGPYVAVVLYVFPKEGGTQTVGNWRSEIAKEDGKNFWQVIARIPEIHQDIPWPTDNNDLIGISMHDQFVGQSLAVQEPKVGDLIWVDYVNKQEMTDGIYIRPCKELSVEEIVKQLLPQLLCGPGGFAVNGPGGGGMTTTMASLGHSGIPTRGKRKGTGLQGFIVGPGADKRTEAHIKAALFGPNGGKCPSGMAWLGHLSANGAGDHKDRPTPRSGSPGRETFIFAPYVTDTSGPYELIYAFHGNGGFGKAFLGSGGNPDGQTVEKAEQNVGGNSTVGDGRYTQGGDFKIRVAYWMRKLVQQGRNFIFVFPECSWSKGSKNKRKSGKGTTFSGKGDEGTFTQFHNQVMAVLQKHFKVKSAPAWITMQGHSRGGNALQNIANTGDFGKVKPQRIILSDCDYSYGGKPVTHNIYNKYIKGDSKGYPGAGHTIQFILMPIGRGSGGFTPGTTGAKPSDNSIAFMTSLGVAETALKSSKPVSIKLNNNSKQTVTHRALYKGTPAYAKGTPGGLHGNCAMFSLVFNPETGNATLPSPEKPKEDDKPAPETPKTPDAKPAPKDKTPESPTPKKPAPQPSNAAVKKAEAKLQKETATLEKLKKMDTSSLGVGQKAQQKKAIETAEQRVADAQLELELANLRAELDAAKKKSNDTSQAASRLKQYQEELKKVKEDKKAIEKQIRAITTDPSKQSGGKLNPAANEQIKGLKTQQNALKKQEKALNSKIKVCQEFTGTSGSGTAVGGGAGGGLPAFCKNGFIGGGAGGGSMFGGTSLNGVAPENFKIPVNDKQRDKVYGTFSFTRPNPNKAQVKADPAWVKANIVSLKVTCRSGTGTYEYKLRLHRLCAPIMTKSWELACSKSGFRPTHLSGHYYARFARGGGKIFDHLSMHAWGAAFDVMADLNPYGTKKTLFHGRWGFDASKAPEMFEVYKSEKSRARMKKRGFTGTEPLWEGDIKLWIKIMMEHGWRWGGLWKTPDDHHFQLKGAKQLPGQP
tara:strand:+ start:18476 stop:21595 length:3120 start_codon:yes stop_codon:yes gene_type:complete